MYFSPRIGISVKTFIEFYHFFQLAKEKKQNMCLYNPLLVPKKPCEEIKMDIVLGLPKEQIGND
jgi:hypothetical protein